MISMENPIGFIGLGNMGGVLAHRLLDTGHKLVVCDLKQSAIDPFKARGAGVAVAPQDVASQAEVVFVSLPTEDSIREVALGKSGIINGTKVKIYIDLSTSGPDTARAVAAVLEGKNIAVIDCPVSGSVIGAKNGTLALIAAGDVECVEKMRPVFQALGRQVFYVGARPGMAQMMKLVNNLLSVTASVVTAEAMVLGVKAGLDPETMLDVINASTGRNTATDSKFPNFVLPRTFASGSVINILLKDMSMCVRQAEELGATMWVAHSVRQLLRHIVNQGAGNDSNTSIVQHFERWAGGVEVKSSRVVTR